MNNALSNGFFTSSHRREPFAWSREYIVQSDDRKSHELQELRFDGIIVVYNEDDDMYFCLGLFDGFQSLQTLLPYLISSLNVFFSTQLLYYAVELNELCRGIFSSHRKPIFKLFNICISYHPRSSSIFWRRMIIIVITPEMIRLFESNE